MRIGNELENESLYNTFLAMASYIVTLAGEHDNKTG